MKQTICDNPDCRKVLDGRYVSSTFAIVTSNKTYNRKEYEFCAECTGKVSKAIGSEFRKDMIESITEAI